MYDMVQELVRLIRSARFDTVEVALSLEADGEGAYRVCAYAQGRRLESDSMGLEQGRALQQQLTEALMIPAVTA